jgi:hypothetical protein
MLAALCGGRPLWLDQGCDAGWLPSASSPCCSGQSSRLVWWGARWQLCAEAERGELPHTQAGMHRQPRQPAHHVAEGSGVGLTEWGAISQLAMQLRAVG